MTVMKNIVTASTSTASAAEIQKVQETISKIQELMPTLKGALWTPVMTLDNSEVALGSGEFSQAAPCSFTGLAVSKFCLENGIKMVIWKQQPEQVEIDDSKAAPADLYTMNITMY